jgi:hypothetical protein
MQMNLSSTSRLLTQNEFQHPKKFAEKRSGIDPHQTDSEIAEDSSCIAGQRLPMVPVDTEKSV